jgi:hypothetical protein
MHSDSKKISEEYQSNNPPMFPRAVKNS